MHIMSKLRFQVIPVIISGSRLVSGGDRGRSIIQVTSMLLSPSFNGIFSYLKYYWSVVIKLSNYPIDKQLRTAHLFLSSLIQAHGQSDITSPTNFMCLLHSVCIFQLYLEFMWRNSIFLVKSLLIYDSRSILKCSHGTFVTFIQENGVTLVCSLCVFFPFSWILLNENYALDILK
jgi:ABC-type multidrug transport system fused ATPase/permease subunit